MRQITEQQPIAQEPQQLIEQVRHRLNGHGLGKGWGDLSHQSHIRGSAVLFLLTSHRTTPDKAPEPCLLLNKRSQKVLQPGDLCCPGGGVERVDRLLAPLMRLPQSPLRQWPQGRQWQARDPNGAKALAVLLTTALREAYEEMRLNPICVSFLGPLPAQKLIMYERLIYPLAGWMPPHQRLKPNWEVERLVYIPLARMLEPANYARLKLSFSSDNKHVRRKDEFPCFIHQGRQGREVFWGATFRIAMDFLNQVFGFQLPDLAHASILARHLGRTYLSGSIMAAKRHSGVENEHDY